MTETFYILESPYRGATVGTVFKVTKTGIFNCKTKDKIHLGEKIVEASTVIEKEFATYLSKNEIKDTIGVFKKYEYVKKLKEGSMCTFKKSGRSYHGKVLNIKDISPVKLRLNLEDNTSVDWKDIQLPIENESVSEAITSDRKGSQSSFHGNTGTDNARKIQEEDFVSDMYLKKDYDCNTLTLKANDDLIGKLICVDDKSIYGRVRSVYSGYKDQLVGIEIDKNYFHRNHGLFMDIPTHTDESSIIIVVKRNYIKISEEGLQFLNDSCVIDINCVKFVEEYESPLYKMDDIVTFLTGKLPSFWRIKRIARLNGFPCLGVTNINDNYENNIQYIPENKVKKLEITKIGDVGEDKTFNDPLRIPEPTPRHSVQVPQLSQPGSDEGRKKGGKKNKRPSDTRPRNALNNDSVILDNFKKKCWGISYVVTKHYTLEISNNGRIIASSICCVKKVDKLRYDPMIVIGSKIKKRTNEGDIRGICRWIGLVNNEEVIGIEEEQCRDGDDNQSNETEIFLDKLRTKIALFKCEHSRDIDNVTKRCGHFTSHNAPIMSDTGRLIISSICCVEKTNYPKIKIGSKIVKNIDGDICGTCRWIGLVNSERFIGIEEEQCDNGDNYLCFDTNIFVGELRIKMVLIRNEKVILYEDYYKVDIGDIVRYKYEGGKKYAKKYAKILKFKTIKNNPYVEVEDTINVRGGQNVVHDIKRSDIISKVNIEELESIPADHPLIDPHSIIVMTLLTDKGLQEDFDVEFTLAGNKYRGQIVSFAEINNISSAIVEFYCEPEYTDLTKYLINSVSIFQNILYPGMKSAVIIERNALKNIPKKIIICVANNVWVMNPLGIDSIVTSKKEDKIIIFKSNGERKVMKLKWQGKVNGYDCIGCVMMEESLHGTDGKFEDNILFTCEKGHGALIPLNKIEQCCIHPDEWGTLLKSVINSPHARLEVIVNKVIVGSEFCCVEKLSEFNGQYKIKLGSRVMKIGSNIFGICRWMGLVNGREVIGVEMTQCKVNHNGKYTYELNVFDDLPGNTVLFLLNEFTLDDVGLCYCSKNDLVIVDDKYIEGIEKGKVLDKTIISKDGKRVPKEIKWEGIVHGKKCVGYEVDNECACGTNGEFGGERLFYCASGKGVLLPVDRLHGYCERDGHNDIIVNRFGAVESDSLCCFEPLSSIASWPDLETGSKLVFKSDVSRQRKIGNCKWMGLVNGRESVGANIKVWNDKDNKYSKKKFQFENGRGPIFTADTIVHDIGGERLRFVVDRFVDVSKIWKVKEFNGDKRGFQINDFVKTYLKEGNEDQKLNGELKWMGMIDNVACVGIDLEDNCGCGMDGDFKNKHRFTCMPGHGVVTTLDNVDKDNIRLVFKKDGMIDANKYLKWEEIWKKEKLHKKNVLKDKFVFVCIERNNDNKWKRKGILRWCGTMNGEYVAVVELDQDYDNGTDGRFWRHRLIQCKDKRAVAVLWDNICEYIPFEEMDIPKKIFDKIGVNSAVVVYKSQNGNVSDIYGTVRWSGIDEYDHYKYGIELDDRHMEGTDGEFLGQRLFKCQKGFGILADINEVAPDERFTQLDLSDKDIPESKTIELIKFGLPLKCWYGENYGIQGNSNSCYFDSSTFALFSKSDVLDFMIHPKINENEENETTKKFREIMAHSIVYPLREFGFVSFHKTKQMRDVIKDYGPKFEEMTTHESDMENVAALLAKLSPNEQLLRLTTFQDPYRNVKNEAMFLQLFVTLTNSVHNISSQQMLDISMAQNMIMFDEQPTCLIMQAPRDARGINCYDNVLPLRMIEISKLCYYSYKQCGANNCSNVATWQCKVCMVDTLRVKSGLLCAKHECGHSDALSVPDSSTYSRSQVQLQLKAIICIEKAHFVSYVKEDEFNEEWVFFDSMSTQSNATNYSVPKVSLEREVSDFLNQDEETMKSQLSKLVSSELKRVVKDSYIFVYHNASKTCY